MDLKHFPLLHSQQANFDQVCDWNLLNQDFKGLKSLIKKKKREYILFQEANSTIYKI